MQDFLNKVYNGDILELLSKLPDNSVDMVYGDPDYNVGIKYNDNSYTRSFNEYIKWYIALAKESMRVLKRDGNMFLINYPKQNSYLRVMYLDDACYSVNDYAWVYNTNIGQSPRHFTTAHRSILHCTKTKDNKFYKDQVAVPYQNPTDKRILKNIANGSKGRMPYSWFYYDLVKNVSKEKTFHSCQIPAKLSEMLINSCTKEGENVLIHFGGSGSEIVLCKELHRNFISAEIDKKYYEMILDRLQNGIIKEKYRLNLKKTATPEKPVELHKTLRLLEERAKYGSSCSPRKNKTSKSKEKELQ
ncbi:MAG: site-specific DNA-methyltransferase [Nitrospirae bacterium]|nr:site-specific DNA-methyltransferase [Nitrospirota bacterium]